MEAKACDRDLIGSYREADPQGRLEIVFANYHIFPIALEKAFCTIYIYDERVNKSYSSGELGGRYGIKKRFKRLCS